MYDVHGKAFPRGSWSIHRYFSRDAAWWKRAEQMHLCKRVLSLAADKTGIFSRSMMSFNCWPWRPVTFGYRFGRWDTFATSPYQFEGWTLSVCSNLYWWRKWRRRQSTMSGRCWLPQYISTSLEPKVGRVSVATPTPAESRWVGSQGEDLINLLESFLDDLTGHFDILLTGH